MVMYLLMALAYVVGGALLGAGLYLGRQDQFPSWWRRWMLWPLVTVTPKVIHLQGWAGVALGASILAVGFTLVLFAMVAYIGGVVLFLYSAYLSRRQTN